MKRMYPSILFPKARIRSSRSPVVTGGVRRSSVMGSRSGKRGAGRDFALDAMTFLPARCMLGMTGKIARGLGEQTFILAISRHDGYAARLLGKG
jgi:hypothetical protein